MMFSRCSVQLFAYFRYCVERHQALRLEQRLRNGFQVKFHHCCRATSKGITENIGKSDGEPVVWKEWTGTIHLITDGYLRLRPKTENVHEVRTEQVQTLYWSDVTGSKWLLFADLTFTSKLSQSRKLRTGSCVYLMFCCRKCSRTSSTFTATT